MVNRQPDKNKMESKKPGITRSYALRIAFVLCMFMQSLPGAYGDIISGLKLPLRSSGDLLFYSDIYQFETVDDKIRMEVCYSLDLSQLNTEPLTRDEFGFRFDLTLLNRNGGAVLNLSDTKKLAAGNFNSEKQAAFIDLIKFYIQPDTLKFKLVLSDSVSGRSGVIESKVTVRPVSDMLSCSDPVFIAYLSKTSDTKNVFNRHNLEMVPNPARFYDKQADNSHMYIYFEVNNLDYNPEKPSLYALKCSVENLAGESVSAIEHPQLNKVGANTSRIEKVNLGELTTGMYVLDLHITDMANDHSSQVRRYFRVLSEDSDEDLVMPMSEADVEKYYDQIKYIARDQELKIYRQLDAQAKQEFLISFWKGRDPTPDTGENEFMIEHFRRIEYCKQNFRNGINSDRGRIYIKYGPPVGVERSTSTLSYSKPVDVERSTSTLSYSKPVEIWTYSIEGRVEFVFVDRTNDDNYVLVHSTHPDEFFNPDWQSDFKVYR
jgi:GWxTD domain-containing protein